MIRLFETFDPGFFDLIIADESHRSIYNIYGDLFRYFDALQVGLTATPVEMVSRSTCQLFGCDFKQLRIELRSIMQHRDKGIGPPIEAPVIDITDSDEINEKQSTYLKAVDMASYRLKVEQALKALFEQNPVLQKIRNGTAVSEAELDNLNALIHTQHPDIDLNILKSFYDTAAPMEQILRSIVGMDADKVNQRFAVFIQHYPSLSPYQVPINKMLREIIIT